MVLIILVVIMVAWIAYEVRTAPMLEDEPKIMDAPENSNPDNQKDNK